MHQLDLRGYNCPLPVLKTKKYLAQLSSGESVTVITDDPDSEKDLQTFCQKTGNTLLSQSNDNNQIVTIITRR